MMQGLSLVYVHIGSHLPEYLFDSVFQTILINKYSCKVYIILSDPLVDEANRRISCLDDYFKDSQFHSSSIVNVIPVSSLQTSNLFERYKSAISKFGSIGAFRDGFWISTTSRFFYISALARSLKLESLFHIESDIMMYIPFNDLYAQVSGRTETGDDDSIWMVQDSHERVIPSVLFFKRACDIERLVEFITQQTETSDTFINDMNILGRYPHKKQLACSPQDAQDKNGGIMFDGAAVGQYMGGVDMRNTLPPDAQQTSPYEFQFAMYNNKTRGFINETSDFKPNTCVYYNKSVVTDDHKVPIKVPICTPKQPPHSSFVRIANLHIHSKQLHEFSSIFDIRFDDIITGDRIVSLCDFVITTREIYKFHKGIDAFANDIIIVKDWATIDTNKLNGFFRETKRQVVRLFVYTHILEAFVKAILPKLDSSLHYVIYTHNSDHPFDETYTTLLQHPCVKHVFAQNINHPQHPKLTLLPIGIANSMWDHGDLVTLYSVMSTNYKYKKQLGVYVNINAQTYGYRKTVLEAIVKTKAFSLAGPKPYKEYLVELSKHRFCLCLRGNGLDTHRFWESLYLGVIPIVINNSHTSCNTFLRHMESLNIPFVELRGDDAEAMFATHNDDYFSEQRYQQILKKQGMSLYNLEALKTKYYVSV